MKLDVKFHYESYLFDVTLSIILKNQLTIFYILIIFYSPFPYILFPISINALFFNLTTTNVHKHQISKITIYPFSYFYVLASIVTHLHADY